MAMINCPECGKEVSGEATTCPHCGRTLKPSFAVPILLACANLCALLVAAFMAPPFLEPSSERQVQFHSAYLTGILTACADAAAVVAVAVGYATKSKPPVLVGVVCSFASVILLAYGMTQTSEFFLLIPLMAASPILSLVAAAKSYASA